MAMSGKGRRAKGREAEAAVEKIIRERGIPTDRSIGGRRQMSGDVIGLPGIALEVKRQETLKLDAWSRKIEADCPSHVTPAVAYRRSREPWRVALLLEDFLDLLEERSL